MSNNIRINTTPGGTDKFVKVSLEQDFDFIEILSLKLTQEEVYNKFCSDYGVVVGRVIVNNGFGVPNAKVSVFIPISEEDRLNPEKLSMYPYTSITDKNVNGLRYNLLPKNQLFECHTPVGDFPDKRGLIDNEVSLEIYEKYYKFTSTTNESGDYMIFGVPVGNHTVHVDVDMSDMGVISQRPYDFITKGYAEDQFLSPTKFNKSTNIDTLTHIKTQNIGVNVIPFWGEEDNCQIGISRVDVDLKYDITPSAIFMGSIFGDTDKNSVNKNCLPRRSLGRISDQTTSEGSIEMIRKTYDGEVERFDVNGGRVINDEGAWAYQIPMNLDFVITNEFGKIIPSNDPNRGIPTRALTRFRIGMDQTGGEGRLRTRAKFLIPNNPNTFEDVDYEFGENTKEESFTELQWNKLYTVKSFIPRYQPSNNKNDKHFIGLKMLDDASGDVTPFPFNRLDTDPNPLFSVLCVIISIIVGIITLINSILIPLINVVIGFLNVILTTICAIIEAIGRVICRLQFIGRPNRQRRCLEDVENVCRDIDFIPCISLECEDQRYAPGCLGGNALEELEKTHPDVLSPNGVDDIDAGYTNCVTLQLADSLNAFSFEFYNDWVNGSLYAFLLKYRQRRRGRERFCEYDCGDFSGGVDGDENGNPDNRCNTSFIVDRDIPGGEDVESVGMRDGIVKKYGDEFYYPPITHQSGLKMFATDIVNLGAILECDINNVPVLHNLLIPTTYNLPPLADEFNGDGDVVSVSGMDSAGLDGDNSLLFNVTCLGVSTNTRNIINIRRLCEIGVDLDENREDEILNPCCNSFAVDNSIDNCEVDGIFFRNAFGWLNDDSIETINNSNMYFPDVEFPNEVCNEFNTYNTFRDFTGINVNQPMGNSFYFYFGLRNGKTGLDLAKSKFFTICENQDFSEILISGVINDVTTINGVDGSIDVSVEGGEGGYSYIWVGPNGFTSIAQNISMLEEGNYEVTVTDSVGNRGVRFFNVNGPIPISCFISTLPVSIDGALDGSIQLNNIVGGTPLYSFEVITLPSNTPIFNQTNLNQTDSLTVSGLGSGDYMCITTDSNGETCNDVVSITQPVGLQVLVTTSNLSCNLRGDGVIDLVIGSGNPPYTIEVFDSNNNLVSSGFSNNSLDADIYSVNVTDNINQTFNQVVTLTEPDFLEIVDFTKIGISCNSNGSIGNLIISGGTSPYNYSWIDDNGDEFSTAPQVSNLLSGFYTLIVTDINGCSDEVDIIIEEFDNITISLVSTTSPSTNGVDGVINVSSVGGSGGETYEIVSGPTINTTGLNNGEFINLSSGTYNIRVIDTSGCDDGLTLTI